MSIRPDVLMKRRSTLHLQILPCLAPRAFAPWPSSIRKCYSQTHSQPEAGHRIDDTPRDGSPPRETNSTREISQEKGSVERSFQIHHTNSIKPAGSDGNSNPGFNARSIGDDSDASSNNRVAETTNAKAAFQKRYDEIWGTGRFSGKEYVQRTGREGAVVHPEPFRFSGPELIDADTSVLIRKYFVNRDQYTESELEHLTDDELLQSISKEIWGTASPDHLKWLEHQPQILHKDTRRKLVDYQKRLSKEHKLLWDHLATQSSANPAHHETPRQRRLRLEGRDRSSVWRTSFGILDLRASKGVLDASLLTRTLNTHSPTVRNWHQWFLECPDPNSARAYWLGQPLDLAATMWPELMITALAESPMYALKLLFATHCRPYPPSHAVADCIDYILSHFYIYSKQTQTDETTAEINYWVTVLLLKRIENPSDPLVLHQNSIFLLLSNTDPLELRNFYRTLKRTGQPLSQENLMHFAYRFGLHGKRKMAMSVLKRMKAEGFDFKGQQIKSVCTVLLKTESQLDGDKQAATDPKVLDFFFESGLEFNIIHYNVMLQNACKAGNHKLAWGIYEHVMRQEIAPNVYTYSILMNDAKKRGDQPVIEKIWATVQDMGIRDEYLATDYLHQMFLEDLEEGRMSMHKDKKGTRFAALLEVYCKYFRLEPLAYIAPVYMAAWPHLPRPAGYNLENRPNPEGSTSESLKPSSTGNSSFVPDQANDQTGGIISNKGASKSLSEVTLQPASDGLIAESTAAFFAFDSNEAQPTEEGAMGTGDGSFPSPPMLMEPSPATLAVMMSSLTRCLPKPPYDPRPFSKRPEETKPYTVRFFEHFHKLVLAGDPAVAGTLSETTRIYNLAITALGRSQTTLPYCTEVIRCMLAKRKTPGDEPKPDEIAVQNIGTPPKPDILTWTCLLQCFIQRHQLQAADKVMQMMAARGVTPNKYTWRMLVHLYSKMQYFDRAVDAVDRMEAAGYMPGPETVKSLQRLLDRQGLLHAMSPKEKEKRWAKKGLKAVAVNVEEPTREPAEVDVDDLDDDNREFEERILKSLSSAPTMRVLRYRTRKPPLMIRFRNFVVNHHRSFKKQFKVGVLRKAFRDTRRNKRHHDAKLKWMTKKKEELKEMLNMPVESWLQLENGHVEETQDEKRSLGHEAVDDEKMVDRDDHDAVFEGQAQNLEVEPSSLLGESSAKNK